MTEEERKIEQDKAGRLIGPLHFRKGAHEWPAGITPEEKQRRLELLEKARKVCNRQDEHLKEQGII